MNEQLRLGCINKKLSGIPCLNCGKTDQVYLGHKTVRFCAHCILSWDREETEIQKAAPNGKAVSPDLPDDLVSRIAGYIKEFEEIIPFEEKLQEALTIQAKAREWQPVVDDLTDVGKLVHLAVRRTSDDIEKISKALFDIRRREYDQAVSDFLVQVGCKEIGQLGEGRELSDLNDLGKEEAKGIANTFNFDLAVAIKNIRQEIPTANRHVYVNRLRGWNRERKEFKSQQIVMHTAMTTRQQAMVNFSENNGLRPQTELIPKVAAEVICQGWINRGKVAFRVANNNPSPFHIGCIHWWQPVSFGKVGNCEDLWVG